MHIEPHAIMRHYAQTTLAVNMLSTLHVVPSLALQASAPWVRPHLSKSVSHVAVTWPLLWPPVSVWQWLSAAV